MISSLELEAAGLCHRQVVILDIKILIVDFFDFVVLDLVVVKTGGVAIIDMGQKGLFLDPFERGFELEGEVVVTMA